MLLYSPANKKLHFLDLKNGETMWHSRKKYKKRTWRNSKTAPLSLSVVVFLLLSTGIMVFHDAAWAGDPPAWYRIRTNSIPHQIQEVIADSQGGLWVTSEAGSEYDPGVWHYAPASPGGFAFITSNERNNYLNPEYLDISVKPQLEAPILYVVRDFQGNTWYSQKNRNVLCQKANGSWQTFAMQNTGSGGVDTTNVDSAHRIRLMDDHDGGAQGKLLIATKSIKRLNSQLNVVENRVVYSTWNNDFINDAFIDSQGRYWIASNRGLEQGSSLINTEYVWTKYPDNPSVPGAGAVESPVNLIQEDSLGNMWFCCSSYGTAGVYCYTVGGQWIKYDFSAPPLSATNVVQSMAAGEDGTMWFGLYYRGIMRYVPQSGGQWTRYSAADLGVKSEDIPSVAWANDGLWFVTGYNSDIPGNGTGVHRMTLEDGEPRVMSYAFRENSATLTSNRLNWIAADKIGGVWFPAYDDPSVARLKPDGSWQQFRGAIDGKTLGSFGIAGVAVDSKNRIYVAPQNAPPVAYDVDTAQSIDLPESHYTDFFYYGLYIDSTDGKWFHGAFGVYHLDADNTTWTFYNSADTNKFADYYVEGALVDDSGNAWFMTRTGITLMKKETGGGVSWHLFKSGDASGYSGGYRIYMDDNGEIWSASKQKFDYQNNTWVIVADTSGFDNRHLRFANGSIPADMDMSGVLPPMTVTDENRMTLDTRGNIYFAYGMGWLPSVNAGIVVRSPVKGDVDRDGLVDLADAIVAPAIAVGIGSQIQSSAADVNDDGKIGLPEFLYVLQSIAGIR